MLNAKIIFSRTVIHLETEQSRSNSNLNSSRSSNNVSFKVLSL